jgi:5'-methylthioadenosine/S-adenosylhomocysteine nucleosidase
LRSAPSQGGSCTTALEGSTPVSEPENEEARFSALLAARMRLSFLAMILIAAALSEELSVALSFFPKREKAQFPGISLYRSQWHDHIVLFLKTGVGPSRAAAKLEKLLQSLGPDKVLCIGYAGALSSELRVGELIVVRKALLINPATVAASSLADVELIGEWESAASDELTSLARKSGIAVHGGTILTSPFIIGDPSQKSMLNRRFGATVVDMETAAIARICSSHGIPFSCVRAVSDGAADTFLAPFSYDPQGTPLGRAMRVAGAGHWLKRLREWRERSALARQSLRTFLRLYFFG